MEAHQTIKKMLMVRLKQKGLEPSLIPGFIRCLANSVFLEPHVNLWQINERLKYLGWDGFRLDYHTLQLALECFEAEGLCTLEHVQGFWFESFDSMKAGNAGKKMVAVERTVAG